MQAFHPVESLTNARQMTFVLSRFMGPYIYLPDRMILKVEVLLSQVGADSIPPAKKVAPINNTFHSLFQSCRIWLGETLVTKNGENYPFKSYMIDFLSMDSNAKFSWMKGQMWHQDTFGHDLANQTNTALNAGFKSRMHRFKNEDQSEYVTHSIPLMGRLHSDLGSNKKGICPGLGMRVELSFSSNDFLIQVPSADTATYSLTITDAVLFCPVGQLSADSYKKIEKGLETKNIKMFINRTEVTNRNIPAKSQLFNEQLFPGAPLPSKMVLAILPTENFLGTQKTNPFYFPRKFSWITRTEERRRSQSQGTPSTFEAIRDAFTPPTTSGLSTPENVEGITKHTSYVEKVLVTLNGESLDGLDGGLASESQDMTNFIRLHYYMGYMQSRTGNAMTYEEFCNGFFFLYYDLTTGGQATNPYVIPAIRQGNLHVQINLSKPYPHELTVLVFAEYPTKIEVNKFRQLSMSY